MGLLEREAGAAWVPFSVFSGVPGAELGRCVPPLAGA